MSGPKEQSSAVSASRTVKIAIWDLPTRLFHWVLAALVLWQWVSGKQGWLDWHMLAGETVLALVLFRLCWGIVGSRYSRFANFVAGPHAARLHFAETLRVLWRGHRAARHATLPGHTPLGSWMILLLLLLLAIQAGTGLFATDDISTDGPLNHLVSSGTAKLLTTIHKVNFKLLLVCAGLHVVAALFYLVRRRENLIAPLITGRRVPPPGESWAQHPFASMWLALALLVLAGLAVWGITSL